MLEGRKYELWVRGEGSEVRVRLTLMRKLQLDITEGSDTLKLKFVASPHPERPDVIHDHLENILIFYDTSYDSLYLERPIVKGNLGSVRVRYEPFKARTVVFLDKEVPEEVGYGTKFGADGSVELSFPYIPILYDVRVGSLEVTLSCPPREFHVTPSEEEVKLRLKDLRISHRLKWPSVLGGFGFVRCVSLDWEGKDVLLRVSTDGPMDTSKVYISCSDGTIVLSVVPKPPPPKAVLEFPEVATFGGRGYSEENLLLPQGLEADGKGNFYVADSRNHCVKKFSLQGELLMVVGGYGDEPGKFNQPTDVALDESGNTVSYTHLTLPTKA